MVLSLLLAVSEKHNLIDKVLIMGKYLSFVNQHGVCLTHGKGHSNHGHHLRVRGGGASDEREQKQQH